MTKISYSKHRPKDARSVTVTFKLPEMQEEFKEFLRGPAALHVLRALNENLRSKAKHSDIDGEWAAKARELLHDLVREEDEDLLW